MYAKIKQNINGINNNWIGSKNKKLKINLVLGSSSRNYHLESNMQKKEFYDLRW